MLTFTSTAAIIASHPSTSMSVGRNDAARREAAGDCCAIGNSLQSLGNPITVKDFK
jgi:hypothetical protein